MFIESLSLSQSTVYKYLANTDLFDTKYHKQVLKHSTENEVSLFELARSPLICKILFDTTAYAMSKKKPNSNSLATSHWCYA